MKLDIARAWKDEAYRQSLSSEELAILPTSPVGELELTDNELAGVFGGKDNEKTKKHKKHHHHHHRGNDWEGDWEGDWGGDYDYAPYTWDPYRWPWCQEYRYDEY